MTLDEMFEAVSRRIVADHPGVVEGHIFHASGLKTGAGKFFAFVRKEELVLKLPAERVDELIAGGVEARFDAGRGRPMKEWVTLRPRDEAACAAYVEEARRFVSAQRVERRS